MQVDKEACVDAPGTIRGLFFADDICLLAETMEDMQHMLTICEQWAEEFGMSFNAGKSEMMQLAGRISQQRPEVAFAGGVLKWVTEFRYLGVPIFQCRRKRIPLPEPQLWQSYHRVMEVLVGPYPLLDQLMLVKATIMNVALFFLSPYGDQSLAGLIEDRRTCMLSQT